MSPSETGSYNTPDARSTTKFRKIFRLEFLVFSAGETRNLSQKNRMFSQARQMKAK